VRVLEKGIASRKKQEKMGSFNAKRQKKEGAPLSGSSYKKEEGLF